MCIRDRSLTTETQVAAIAARLAEAGFAGARIAGDVLPYACLLYTSDAADERSSVDLGGRRIIKKKNNETSESCHLITMRIYNELASSATMQKRTKTKDLAIRLIA